MVTRNAFMRIFRNPVFTLRCVLYYFLSYKDIYYLKSELSKEFSVAEIAGSKFGASASLKEIALYLIIRKYKPKFMIETGVASGISTYFILKAMNENGYGRLVSIDLPNYNPKGYKTSEGTCDGVYLPRGKKPGWVIPKDFRPRWKLIEGDSRSELKRLDPKGLDAFQHDSEHSYATMSFELNWALGKMRKGIILCDDANSNSAWEDFLSSHQGRLARIANPLDLCSVEETSS